MEHKQKYIINLRYALFLVFLCTLVTGCPSGKTSVIGKTRSQISPNRVELFYTAPHNYEVIAIVEASDDTGWTPAGSEENAVHKLKKQAAKLGANGLLLERINTNNSVVMGMPWITKIATGKAIYVHQGKIEVNASNGSIPPSQASNTSNKAKTSNIQPLVVPSSSTSNRARHRWKKPVE